MDEIEGGNCYWANMPPELLREVLMKIEDSESSWPARKHVVACAGVCKSWREIIKELIKTLEVSGKITFPISIKQPGPRESVIQCFVKRNRATQMHYLYLSLSQALADDGKFLLAARRFRRPAFTEYVISLHPDHMFRASGSYIGKLRSNFLGNKFVVYDALPPHAGAKMLQTRSTQMVGLKISPRVPAGNYPVAQITYELNVLGARSPRRMHCVMDTIPASAIKPGGVAPIQIDFPFSKANSFPAIPFFWSNSNRLDKSLSAPLDSKKEASLVLRNEAPRWNQQLHCWCLNFHGRVTVASVKNFQLVASPENGVVGAENEKIFLQFGKVGKDAFTMDFSYPLSAFQAFAISLSSFDTKSTRE
ncbi:tubby-like F-box protein 3 isoform X2 [Olea europaea var. sylvestris]|uniref:Tubby-like F-box 3 n=1 Tax=Olea europaea subsp. europaea TaxID=158383 RepID=A0A8S0VAZ3_OLEEU|nr:tubby-like F-box protein 3 isoform X1 [Olea europaea var. sylvestris]XP_022873404.1 tubby-like F-box protein 3 isoform X2 [Olea europaea var. sylvestris]CAA3027332.1 tubby-like F-box 3 [Olea europaea subsp. europaea]